MGENHSVFPEELPFWSKEMLHKFCEAATRLNYKKGDIILHPLMTNQFLFLVESGIVDQRYFARNGDVMTIQQVRPGELFGLKAIFNDGTNGETIQKYFFIVANTDVQLLRISREKLLALMESDFAFTKGITRYFVYRITMVERKMMNSVIFDNYQNMLLTLLDLAENIKDNTAVVRITQQNLADMLALSRQSISAYLTDMVKRRLISVKRGRIIILDWDALNMELL